MKLGLILDNVPVLETNADFSTELTGISYDSRKVCPGHIFFAISGFETDGHLYIGDAVLKGAAAVVCERRPDVDVPYVLVDNCRLALALASCNFFDHPSRKMTVIGITGTNGKTTSSYLIKHVIEKITGAKVGLIGTNGNMIGDRMLHTERTTPESLELQSLFADMLEEGCSFVVMEVSSHSLKLDRVSGIFFDAALFTNLTQDHLDFHKTMLEYAQSKKLLFTMAKKSCFCIDDEWAGFMMDGLQCDVITFSANSDNADFYASDIEYDARGVRYVTKHSSHSVETVLGIPGHFSVLNSLGVTAVCTSLGFSLCDVISALGSAKGVKGRVEIVPIEQPYTVIIDYAHTPDALENVIKSLKPLTEGRLIVLFGCGGDRDRSKRPIMGRTVSGLADLTVVTSDNPRTEQPEEIIAQILEGIDLSDDKTKVIVDRIEAIHWAIDNALPGDVILLAGKGHEDYQIIGHTKHHMDEREIVSEYIREKQNDI